MNIPHVAGERYRCFVVHREDRGWGGPYGMTRRATVWQCEDCGYKIHGADNYSKMRMADHHECGHAPCGRCGKMLLRRKDGTPRQHSHRICPGKSQGDKIELEFVKNMTVREYV